MKKIIIPIVILIILAVIAVPVYTYFAPVTVQKTSVKITPESTSTEIGGVLKENKIIRNEFAFKIFLKVSGEGNKLQAGNYEFDGKYSMGDVADELKKGGKVEGIKVTIPEGYNMSQIADVLVDAGFCTKDEFNNAAANGDYKYDYLPAKGEATRLQGFLYPETYLFEEGTTAETIIATMLKQFDSNFSDEWRTRLKIDGRTVLQWVTMASIVEKEAVVKEDRPIISGVFYNRLEKNMLLQSCATVQYALGKVKPVLSNEDVKIASPFNTYINQGLPPAPIASPGHASLEAAMYPTKTDYIFFVAKRNGAHIFTKTYEEHLAAKSAIENGKYDNE